MKRKLMSTLLSAAAYVAFVLGSTAPLTQAQSADAVTIENRSNYDLYRVFLSPASSNYWGYDQLGSRVLESGYRYTLPNRFFNGLYDLKLVDEDGDACVVSNVEVNGNTTWDISNSWLLSCEFH